MLHIHTKIGFRKDEVREPLNGIMAVHMCQAWSPAILPPGSTLFLASHTTPHHLCIF